MDRVELIIDRVRKETENTDFGDTYGISDNEMIGYLNDAQDRVFSEITKKHPKFFIKQAILSAPQNQEAIDLPTRIYLGKILLAEYSSTGQEADYYRLRAGMTVERLSYPIGKPVMYFRNNQQMFFIPTPNDSNGFCRVRYVEVLPKLDKRRAQVQSVTTSGSSITSLVLDVNATVFDRDELMKRSYMCVVDKNGSQKMAAIPFSDIDATSGVVTIDAGFEFESTESIAAGDYIVSGEFSINKSSLLDITERYLVSHLRMEVLDRDANNSGTATQSSKMQMLLGEIIDAFAEPGEDVIEIPLIDPGFEIVDDYY